MKDDLIVFSVYEITQHLKQVIETQIEPLYVRGEVSNFVRHGSGHIYFNLKDDNSTLRCTFFRFVNLKLDFFPEDGMEVTCFGSLSVYEKGGTYNLNVQTMSLSGKGDLAQRFELLKKKLQEEGLFEAELKKPLPRYPQRIGVITSPTGAAWQDIQNILTRRFPVAVDIYPAQVQGAEAPKQLVAGLEYFNAVANVDVIILTRGGGSQEDLFCFNDEKLARAIFASKIPVISAVGHEIDFSISDFVADLRAPTPSAAAELVVPDRKDLLAYLASLAVRLDIAVSKTTGNYRSRLNGIKFHMYRLNPDKVWQNLQQRLDMVSLSMLRKGSEIQSALHGLELRKALATNTLHNRFSSYVIGKQQHVRELKTTLSHSLQYRMIVKSNLLERRQLQLEANNPRAILGKGYSLVMRDRKVVPSIRQMHEKEKLQIIMKDGSAEITIDHTKPKDLAIDTD